MNEYLFRPALPTDADKLTELAFIAKGYWGYPKEWLAAWRNELTVTPEMIKNCNVFVVEKNGVIKGFWLLEPLNSNGAELLMFFVHPEEHGKGVGRKLWALLKQEALKMNLEYFTFGSDPHVDEFYLKMGAIKVEEEKSSVIPGRKYWVFKYLLKKLIPNS